MNFFDLHCDTAYRCYNEGLSFENNALAVSLQKAGKFDKWHQCFAMFIKDGTKNPFEYYKNTLTNLKKQILQDNNNLNPIFTVENGILIENDLNRIETLFNDGVRVVTLTWNAENQIAGGAYSDGGLKPFGKEVIKSLNMYNMFTDLAHLNKKSFYDALEMADKPIITHTCLDYVNVHRRNIDDKQLRTLIEKGGIIGLCFYPIFLGEGDVFENIYKNIFHVLDMGYEDYISIGSDFDGADMDDKLFDISAVPKLFEYLQTKNIDDNILNKIFFENAYNFFKQGECL